MVPWLALVLAATAQAAPAAAADSPVAAGALALSRRLRGLARVDGVLRAVGPDYKVDFRAGGFVLTPPLGADAPRRLPLAFELEAVRVGGKALLEVEAPREPVRPSEDGWFVAYGHGAGVTERYEVRLDGIEQSFVFDSLPAERGELVVRGRVATELELPAPGTYSAGLAFRAAERGGVRIGGVRGIDASGREAAGALRFDGTHIELVLPAEFVRSAALPLVLDPLIGGIATVYNANDVGAPNVAVRGSDPPYLVAFERHLSTLDSDVYALRLDATGAPVGPLLLLESSIFQNGRRPYAAFTKGGYAVVTWHFSVPPITTILDVAACAIGDTSVGPTLTVAGTPGQAELDALAWGPYHSGPETTAIVLWKNDAVGILGSVLDLDTSTLVLTPSAPFTVTSSTDAFRPAIARGVHSPPLVASSTLVVWQQRFTAPVTHNDIHGRLLGFDGTMPLPEFPIVSTVGTDEQNPAVDGTLARFAVAYERRASISTGDRDVVCRRVVNVAGSPVVGPEVTIDADPGLDELEPDVADLGHKFAVAWRDQVAAGDHDVHLRLLDEDDCAICDAAEVVLGPTSDLSVNPAIVSDRSAVEGASDEDSGLVVWETFVAPIFVGNLFAQRIEAFGPSVTGVDAGGGCGAAGAIGADGFAAMGGPMSVSLSGIGAGAVVAFLNLAGGAAPTACGACTWEPFSALVFPKALLGASATSVSFELPCNPSIVGATVRFQWTVAFTADSPCPLAPNISISDRLDVTFAE